MTIATGLVSLVRPRAVQGFTGLTAEGGRGISGIGAVLGGFLIALGAVPFLLGETAYGVLGIAYPGVGNVRGVSILVDKSAVRSNLISLIVEIILGVILVLARGAVASGQEPGRSRLDSVVWIVGRSVQRARRPQSPPSSGWTPGGFRRSVGP